MTYEQALQYLRQYAESQRACGNPATLKDLREYRNWKNMPHDSDYDARLLMEINGDHRPLMHPEAAKDFDEWEARNKPASPETV